MKITTIKKELNTYLPLLTEKQQELLLNMAKSILHVDPSSQRISVKQYNKEIEKSEKQIADGLYTTQEDVEKEVLGLDQTQKYLEGKTPKKVIVVHNKIVNIVI